MTKPIIPDPICRRRRFDVEIIELCAPRRHLINFAISCSVVTGIAAATCLLALVAP
jgi:hypothetical protein